MPPDVPDVLFITTSSAVQANKAFDFDLLTSKFVGRLNNSTPVLIESVRINSIEGAASRGAEAEITFKFGHRKQLFSRGKVLNLQGRHLALAVFYYRPYITVSNVVGVVAPTLGIFDFVGLLFCPHRLREQEMQIVRICSITLTKGENSRKELSIWMELMGC